MAEIDDIIKDGEGAVLAEDVDMLDTDIPSQEIVEARLMAHDLAARELNGKESLSSKLFPGHNLTVGEVEAKYPPRQLKKGAMVTRVAPSPTGFMHIGGIYVALISERLARQTEGVFYLRIEDTDKKREVEGASDLIVSSIRKYGIDIDEGQTGSGNVEQGDYGPYTQSERVDLYRTYAKSLVENGRAYPCFCSGEEMDATRQQQEAANVKTGYYGQWAKCRDRSEDEIAADLESGKSFVLRFKSHGDYDAKVYLPDHLKGGRELAQNDQDAVILKSDGIPTYHFAHVVDDHLMRTTHVIRGDEWLSSTPLHLELFEALGVEPPEYGHIMPIQKMDGTSKRKLSKRKDPEASVTFYDEQGYPEVAIVEYLLNLANSNFEAWRKTNPTIDNRAFQLTLEKLSHSNGALFDFKKLNDISKDAIARFSADEVYTCVLKWARRNNPEFAAILAQDPDYARSVFDIQRGGDKPRKDIEKWSDVENYVGYFFDDKFQLTPEAIVENLQGINIQDAKSIIADFLQIVDSIQSNEEWMDKIQKIGLKYGYAESTKAYKANPTSYKGYIADVTKIFRVLLAGRPQTQDLYSIMKVMGKERVAQRLSVVDKLQ